LRTLTRLIGSKLKTTLVMARTPKTLIERLVDRFVDSKAVKVNRINVWRRGGDSGTPIFPTYLSSTICGNSLMRKTFLGVHNFYDFFCTHGLGAFSGILGHHGHQAFFDPDSTKNWPHGRMRHSTLVSGDVSCLVPIPVSILV
jgi:hypothetical protein